MVKVDHPTFKYSSKAITISSTLQQQLCVPKFETSRQAIYVRYYQQSVERILKPLLFASIGFSIPIIQMVTGDLHGEESSILF